MTTVREEDGSVIDGSCLDAITMTITAIILIRTIKIIKAGMRARTPRSGNARAERMGGPR